MNKIIIIALTITLTGCHSRNQNDNSSLASDDLNRSQCINCKLEPFYVDGHWIEGRD